MRVGLVLILLIPFAAASPVLEDPSGDVAIGYSSATMPGQAPELDLIRLDVDEQLTGFLLTLQVADLEPPSVATPADSRGWSINLAWSDVNIEVSLLQDATRGAATDQVEYSASIDHVVAGNRSRIPVAITVDFQADTMTVFVERSLFVDSSGVILPRGAALEQIFVRSGTFGQNWLPPGFRPSYGDRMPDADAGGLSVAFGPSPASTFALRAERPFRLSNGEATTLVFSLLARNDGAEAEFTFEAPSPPPEWIVDLPIRQLRLEEGQEVRIPLLLSMPFAHQHKSHVAVEVHMTSGSTIATEQVGVQFTSPPQPAGHHNKLFIHTTAGTTAGRTAFVNTLEDDPRNSGMDAGPSTISCQGTSGELSYQVMLEPGLGRGIRIDPNATGQLAVAFDSPVAFGLARVAGQALIQAENGRMWAVASWTSEPFDLGQGTTEVQGHVAPGPDLVVDYLEGHALALMIDLEIDGFAGCTPTTDTPADDTFEYFVRQQSPRLLAGGTATLPLLEYHERTESAFEIANVSLSPIHEQTVYANPGDRLAIGALLQSEEKMEVRLETQRYGRMEDFEGANADLALQANKEIQALAQFTIPKDAPDGERSTVTFLAIPDRGLAIPAILRFVIEVDTEKEHDSPLPLQAQDSKGTPAIVFPMLVVALVAAARMRKR